MSDLAPWSPDEDVEREQADQEQRDKLASSVKVIPDIIKWFESQIEYFSSPLSYPIDETTPPAMAKELALMCKHFAAEYEDQRAKFMKDFNQYITEMPIAKS